MHSESISIQCENANCRRTHSNSQISGKQVMRHITYLVLIQGVQSQSGKSKKLTFLNALGQ